MIASKARYGPIPLRFAYLWLRGRSLIFTQKGPLQTIALCLLGLRGIGPALAGNVGTGWAFALCARGNSVRTFLCSLRTDPAPLGVLGAPRDRSYAR